MSSYHRSTKHPVTGEWQEAFWIDDYYGKHVYGVRFPNDEKVYDTRDYELETKATIDAKYGEELLENAKITQKDFHQNTLALKKEIFGQPFVHHMKIGEMNQSVSSSPQNCIVSLNNDIPCELMTLRDHFAGLAMKGLLQTPPISFYFQLKDEHEKKWNTELTESIVLIAYQIAEKMLAQRVKEEK
jgi:hypothetical protein